MALNWKDIGQLDIREIKNLDYVGLFKELRKHPRVLLNLAIITGTLVFIVYYVHASQKSTRSAKIEIPQLEEKVQSVAEYQKLQNALQDFFQKTSAPLSGEDLMDRITDFAVKRNIQIESYTPAKDLKEPLYQLSSINLSISAFDYRDIYLFIHDLERQLPSTHVLKLVAGMDNPYRSSFKTSARRNVAGEKERNLFHIDIEIASTKIIKTDEIFDE